MWDMWSHNVLKPNREYQNKTELKNKNLYLQLPKNYWNTANKVNFSQLKKSPDSIFRKLGHL